VPHSSWSTKSLSSWNNTMSHSSGINTMSHFPSKLVISRDTSYSRSFWNNSMSHSSWNNAMSQFRLKQHRVPFLLKLHHVPFLHKNRHIAFLLKQCHVPFLLELRATSLSSWNGPLSSHFLIRRESDVDNYPLLGIVFLFFMGSWTSTELSLPRSPATTLLQHCADGVAEKTSLWGRSGGEGGGW
jgi:hypothetical protein